MLVLSATDVKQALPMAETITAMQDAYAAQLALTNARKLGLGQHVAW
jgi:hypothetical protein